jgi:CheY-like chemotaxis protein/anti-sigma regulatory factor (Ser/Thr protein kinase)
MSHELRTPLNAVLGFGQLLELQCTDVHQVEGVRQILNGGRHLLGMIDTILDISRIEAGSMALSLEPVHAGGVITDALELVAPLAAERGIRIDARHGAGADRHVRADMQRLKQVLLNLLANGVKYNREGGTISIAAEEIAGERLRILVSDTGPGIAAEQLDNVFVPFQRLGAERTSVEGTGLGLALSKRLIEAMDGTLGVTSEPGHGSTFWVDLAVETSVPEPPLEPAGVQGDGDALSIRRGRARSVLYIEDNLSNVKLLEQLFAKRPDVRLIPSMQGNLGLALAQEHRPDMILLDLHLPDLHGAEVLRRLKANPATAQTPVVIVSADATPGQIQRLLAAGAHAYLTKPLDVRQLLALVDDILWTSEAAMR